MEEFLMVDVAKNTIDAVAPVSSLAILMNFDLIDGSF